MKEALDFLKENNEVGFATIGNGRPQMRVFQIMKQSGTTLWFATGQHKRVFAELQENPAVEIDRLDYYDLTPTPPVLRHYDRASGQCVDLNPFGENKAQR